jgi:hypothetical protein
VSKFTTIISLPHFEIALTKTIGVAAVTGYGTDVRAKSSDVKTVKWPDTGELIPALIRLEQLFIFCLELVLPMGRKLGWRSGVQKKLFPHRYSPIHYEDQPVSLAKSHYLLQSPCLFDLIHHDPQKECSSRA